MIYSHINYHYSNKKLSSGNIIRSDQHKRLSFNRFYRIYKEVADELGVYYPSEFGYAYREKDFKKFDNLNCYSLIVEDERYVTKGKVKYSIYAMMDYGFRHLRYPDGDVRKKIEIQDEYLREVARLYFIFDDIEYKGDSEYISDRFVVV